MTARKPSLLRPQVFGWQDLVRVTGLGEETVKTAIRTGELPGHKVGKKYVVPAEAFEDFKRGRWVPQHRPIFSEPIPVKPQFITRKESA